MVFAVRLGYATRENTPTEGGQSSAWSAWGCMKVDSVPALLDALRRSRLLSSAQMNEIRSVLLPRTDDLETLAALLIQYRYLTPFQTEHILSGSDEPLLLGEYRLLELLGEGGLCKVFKALHTGNREIVALKI